MSLSLTIHRGTREIGGSCIELRSASGQRLVLDAGRPLDAPKDATNLLPETLDRTGHATALICHGHQDHWGLINELPLGWPVYSGAGTAKLIAITARMARAPINREILPWPKSGPMVLGDFRVTPYLTDHSGFDAYMLLVEADGKRVFYSGDFRRHGRKASLVDAVMRDGPREVDALILEGTNLGTDKPTVSEHDLEMRFANLVSRTPGRTFVTWSGQNIDRTVTLYRAAKRSNRNLVIDLYTAEVLEAISEGTRLPRAGFSNLKIVLTRGLVNHYRQIGRAGFLSRMAAHGLSAKNLEGSRDVIMVRDGLLRDYKTKGVTPTPDDSYSFSMWNGYLAEPSACLDWFKAAGSRIEHIHTSGHASARDLIAFAKAIDARSIIPVHGTNWDTEKAGFQRVLRLGDGESVTL